VTNSGTSSSRALHVDLASQQRRLRHLRSIAARNIVNKNGSPLLDTFFTLHLCVGDCISRDFYKSEVIRDSLNPTWRSLDFGMLPDLLDTSASCFVVRIWGGQEEQYTLLIEWKVNLDGLRYTGQQIRSRNPNEIIFGLNDGYYAADFDQKDQLDRKKNTLLQVDQSSVRNSYSVFSLLRLHTAQRAIKQTQVTVQKIGKEIEEKLRTTATCTGRKKERECMLLRIAMMQNELQRQRRALSREVDLRQKERTQLQRKEEAFSVQYESLKEENEALSKLQKECTAKREQFLKANAQLTFRCRQLLYELSYIYPIDVVNQADYVICGVKLPNSEDFQAKDDGSVAVALGYTSHLVLMISCFLQIPLRYPVMHKGSRSSIKDTITDRLTEKEREFPLYSRGERFHFEYGVYLLNKNIAQKPVKGSLAGMNWIIVLRMHLKAKRLAVSNGCDTVIKHHLILRYQHGLTTPDLQQTLPNLKNFLEHGLMVRCDRHSVSGSIAVPAKSQHGLSAVSDTSYSCHASLPDQDARKKVSSEADNVRYKSTPPPSYNTVMGEELPVNFPLPSSQHLFPHSMPMHHHFTRMKEEPKPDRKSANSMDNSNSSSAQDTGVVDESNVGVMNGSLVQGLESVDMVPEINCPVEQAEEIIGTEATRLSDEAQLEDYRCIPVDHAIAVECDEQVLGELDVAGFEEFSRRIYALNENTSSFRRPRKGSDK
uniref:UV radiation resistance associated gene n=3 Tax=Tetraodon nigroviridis TaxID=99883 RepID=H3CDN0_TETNG